MTIPDTLERKLALWKARGQFVRYRWEMFHPASWLAIYAGFDLFPDDHDPAADTMDPTYLARSLKEMRDNIARLVGQTPDHAHFLAALDAAVAA